MTLESNNKLYKKIADNSDEIMKKVKLLDTIKNNSDE